MAIVIPQRAPISPTPAMLSRRAAWGFWAGLTASAALVGAGTVAYMWPRRTLTFGDAGSVGDYVVGAVRYFSGEVHVANRLRESGYYVVRRQDGFVALGAFCTHQPGYGCR